MCCRHIYIYYVVLLWYIVDVVIRCKACDFCQLFVKHSIQIVTAEKLEFPTFLRPFVTYLT